MKLTSILLMMSFLLLQEMELYDFKKDDNLSRWVVVDDSVMGGRSLGHLEINGDGNALYYGNVSLENNGGFSSLRYQFDRKKVDSFKTAYIRLKGDGKRYQFRVKSDQNDYQSYIYYFNTTGEWETIEIPLHQMKPSFRGRALDIPDYEGEVMEELAFLIANYKAESFRLEIDKIYLK
jgi:NADH dehydrogenase [ubiquinone] 1 alpha subcomplex assembly factor 1